MIEQIKQRPIQDVKPRKIGLRARLPAEAALEQAKRDHQARVEDIDKDRTALDRRAQAEDARWRKKKEELEASLRKARSGSHLRLV